MRFVQDFRYAIRALSSGRLVTILAIIAFALGIGVTTAVFSIFSGVLLKPLPFPDQEEIVSVYDTQPACNTCPASFPKYHDWKARNQVFAAIGGSTPAPMVLTGAGDPERVAAMSTTATLVDVFGVKPVIGRWYSDAEDQPNGRKVVVLTYAFWNRRWGRDAQVLGKTMILNGDPYEVIGVMPEGFSHRAGEIFVPLQRTLDPATRGSHFLATYARLKKGVTLTRATVEMTTR
jgi:putative ABC transport system permease protein